MGIVQHKEREAKVLYDFTLLSEADPDQNRVVFLSERDFAIILTATEKADILRHRVFYDASGDIYNTVTPEDFITFSLWVNDLRVRLGDYILSNEYLERIAIALESIDQKTGEILSWDDMIDDLETTLGIGNAFVEILKWIGNLIPSLKAKVDVTPLILGFWEYYTWKAPILALLTGMNASLAGSAAAALAEKPLSLIRTVTSVFDSILSLNNRIYEFILGDWNWYDDILKPIWESFISTGDGGTGGDNPDTDPDNRVAVSINQTNIDNDTFSPTINVTCSSCGSSGGCGCVSSGGVGGLWGVDPAPNSGQPAPGEPPTDWPETAGPYNNYKCKAANVLVLNLAEMLAQVDQIADQDFTLIGETQQPIIDWIASKLNAAASWTGNVLIASQRQIAAMFSYLYAWPGNTPEVGPEVIGPSGELRLALLDDRENAVCEIYSSSTVSEARTAIEGLMAGYASDLSLPGDAITVMENWLSEYLTNAWLNRLFEPDPTITGYTDSTAVDCGACGCPLEFDYGEGDLTINGESRTLTSTVNPGNGRHYIQFNTGDCNCDDGPVEVIVVSLTGYIPNGETGGDAASSWVECDNTDNSLYLSGGFELDTPYCGKWFNLSGQVGAFSAEVIISRPGDCE